MGGLAAQLAAQVLTVERVLRLPPTEQSPVALDDHYAEAAWVTASVDDPVNAAIREAGEEEAAAGPAELLARVRAARAAVASALPLDPVLGLLTLLAIRRHGQSALVTALARQERAPRSIAAF